MRSSIIKPKKSLRDRQTKSACPCRKTGDQTMFQVRKYGPFVALVFGFLVTIAWIAAISWVPLYLVTSNAPTYSGENYSYSRRTPALRHRPRRIEPARLAQDAKTNRLTRFGCGRENLRAKCSEVFCWRGCAYDFRAWHIAD